MSGDESSTFSWFMWFRVWDGVGFISRFASSKYKMPSLGFWGGMSQPLPDSRRTHKPEHIGDVWAPGTSSFPGVIVRLKAAWYVEKSWRPAWCSCSNRHWRIDKATQVDSHAQAPNFLPYTGPNTDQALGAGIPGRKFLAAIVDIPAGLGCKYCVHLNYAPTSPLEPCNTLQAR